LLLWFRRRDDERIFFCEWEGRDCICKASRQGERADKERGETRSGGAKVSPEERVREDVNRIAKLLRIFFTSLKEQ
jgi:hypothetical protein